MGLVHGFSGGFLFQRRQMPLIVRLPAEVKQALPHGSEITRRKVRDPVQPFKFSSGKNGMEHLLEKQFLSGVVQIIECDFEGEAPPDGLIKILEEIRRADHHPAEVFHTMQEFINLRDFPAVLRPFPALQQTVDLIEKENGALVFRFGKCCGDILFRSADPHGQDIASPPGDDRNFKFPSEVIDELGFACPRRSGKEEVHPRPVRIAGVVRKEIPDCGLNIGKLHIPLDVQPVQPVICHVGIFFPDP